MSRRKQSNPKPLNPKRSPGECLLETAESLHLPSHEFELISINNGDQSDGHEEDDHQFQDSSYIICAKKLLLKNTTFGPFKGEIIKEKEKQLKQQNSLPLLRNCCNGESNANVDGDDDDNNQNEKVNCNNKNTNNNNTDLQSIIIHLKEEAANWLKILRNANSKDEANASVKVEDGQVWFTIISNINASNEVKIKEQIKFITTTNTTAATNSDSDKMDMKEPDERNEKNSDDDNDDDGIHDEDDDIDEENNGLTKGIHGTRTENRNQKWESNHASDRHTDDEDGSRCSQSLDEDDDDEEELEVDDDCYTCAPCGILFSCKDTLLAHQTYYCINKSEKNVKLNSKDKKNSCSRISTSRDWTSDIKVSKGSGSKGGVKTECDKNKCEINCQQQEHEQHSINLNQIEPPTTFTNDTSHESEITESSSLDDNKPILSSQEHIMATHNRKTGKSSTNMSTPTTTSQPATATSSDNEPISDDNDEGEKNTNQQQSLFDSQIQNCGVKISASGSLSGINSKYNKTGGVYTCKLCTYASDKKALLLRHVKSQHGQALSGQQQPSDSNNNGLLGKSRAPPIFTTTDESDDNNDFRDHNSAAPQDRYCGNCDIQFSSYKTFKVHKQFYCGSRHNAAIKSPSSQLSSATNSRKRSQQESNDAFTSPIQQQQQLNYQKFHLANQTLMNLSSAIPHPSANPAHLLSQPVYIAISTNPLILVPCSYNPSAGGLSLPNITPLGNPFQVPTPLNNTIPSGLNLNQLFQTNQIPLEAHNKTNTTKEPLSKSISPKNLIDDQPLDLSSKSTNYSVGPSTSCYDAIESNKKLKYTTTKLNETELSPEESNTRSTCSPNLIPSTNDPSVQQFINPNPNPNPPSTSFPQVGVDVGVLVKQGRSRCNECNIVFYKHENYLVHKKLYCASRRIETASSSPEHTPDELLARNSSPEINYHASNHGHHHSNVHSGTSPARSGTTASPPGSPPQPQQTVYQFFCVACGIKFTSLDNLQAHQTYYCLKRSILSMSSANQNSNHLNDRTDYFVPQSELLSNEFHCAKCKTNFINEESLSTHSCQETAAATSAQAMQKHHTPTSSSALTMQCFKCTICGYKGHTLRGMRTHVRIHQDKLQGATEESFIKCIDEEIAAKQRNSMGSRRRRSADPNANSNSNQQQLNHLNHTTNSSDVILSEAEDMNSTDNEMFKIHGKVTVGNGNGNGNGNNGDGKSIPNEFMHNCQFCYYSSSYKGNVVRHIKLVHKDLVQTIQLKKDDILKSDFEESHSEVSDHHCDESQDQVKSTPAPSSPKTPEPDVKLDKINPIKKLGPKYCRSCDISFNYLGSFIAHKKYYCSSHNNESSPATSQSSIQHLQESAASQST